MHAFWFLRGVFDDDGDVGWCENFMAYQSKPGECSYCDRIQRLPKKETNFNSGYNA